MEKKPINEGLVRANIKPGTAQDGVQKGGILKTPTPAVKPPPPAPKK